MAIRHITEYDQHTAMNGPDSRVEPASYFETPPGQPLYEMPPRDFNQVFPDSRRVVVAGTPLANAVEIVLPNENGEQQ